MSDEGRVSRGGEILLPLDTLLVFDPLDLFADFEIRISDLADEIDTVLVTMDQ
jgi:hypothetical protein